MTSIKNKELPDRLKFRFFHKPTQKIIPGYGFNPYFVFGDVPDGIGSEYNPAKFEDCVIMQNTGFYDNHQKQIYEGDIVRYTCDSDYCADGCHKCRDCNSGKIYKIYWEEMSGRFKYGSFNENEENYDIDLEEEDTEYCMEIIGNIYENPELLEVENEFLH